MKKLTAIIIILMMIVATATGCSGDGTDASETESTTAAATTASTEAETTASTDSDAKQSSIPEEVLENVIFKETPADLEYEDKTDPVTLTIYYNAVSADEWTWGQDEVTACIQEITGVTIEGTYASDNEGNQLTLMIASGDTLPDIITSINPTSTHMSELIDGELIYPINELMDTYCPKMWDLLFDIETTYYNDEDGNFWYLGRQQIIPNLEEYTVANGWYAVREDIYEDLGSPELSTPDDVWEYIAAFEEVSGNYPEVEYAWLDPVLYGRGNISVAYAMFGGIAQYSSGSYYCYDKETENVYTVIDTEIGKEALKFYYDFAQAGYITQQSFAFENTSDELSVGSALIYSKMNTWEVTGANTKLEQNLPGASYTRILPICEEDVDYHYYDAAFRSAPSATVITKDCSDPERAILFMEFMATEYGNLLATCGIYGEHWQYTTLDNGKIGVEYIGEAANGDASRAELGIGNHTKIWWNLTTNYDLLTAFSELEEDDPRKEISSYVERNTAVTSPNFVSFSSDSDEIILKNQIEEIIATYVTKIILAPDENEFNALYDEMIDILYDNGLESLQNAYAELCKEYVDTLTESGIEWVS